MHVTHIVMMDDVGFGDIPTASPRESFGAAFYIATMPHTALLQRVMSSPHEDDTVVTEFGFCGCVYGCHTQCTMHLMDDWQERRIASLRMPSTRSMHLAICFLLTFAFQLSVFSLSLTYSRFNARYSMTIEPLQEMRLEKDSVE